MLFENNFYFLDKNGEAYKEFMQSLTCYDIAPTHGVVVLLDAQLTVSIVMFAFPDCRSESLLEKPLVINPRYYNNFLIIIFRY